MEQRLRAIHTAIEFIEDHLVEPITVADIAAAAGYSLYHFIRTFNQTVRHTPYDYLMRRRLSEAAITLLKCDIKVIDLALDFQFNNHETFTRAFNRIFGIPPTRWREVGMVDDRILLPRLDQETLEYLNAPDFKPPRLVKSGEMILAGWMTSWSPDPDPLSALWRDLRAGLAGMEIDPDQQDYWGVRVCPHLPHGSAFYLAGLKIPSLETAPPAFVTKIIPAGDFVCLSQLDQAANLDIALTVLYHIFISKSGLILTEPLEIEHIGPRRELLIPVQNLVNHDQSRRSLRRET
jgi:AraC family transcriptional regulator